MKLIALVTFIIGVALYAILSSVEKEPVGAAIDWNTVVALIEAEQSDYFQQNGHYRGKSYGNRRNAIPTELDDHVRVMAYNNGEPGFIVELTRYVEANERGSTTITKQTKSIGFGSAQGLRTWDWR